MGRVDTRPDARPRGTIIDQSPERGTRVPCGSRVNVLVAVPLQTGVAPTCRVPRLVGADARIITNILGDARLSRGSISSRQDARPAGTVIEQRPPADALVSCDSPVDVIVAGEPSGSRPDWPGEDTALRLPWSGVRGSISSRFHMVDGADTRVWIAPRIPVRLTAKDYFAGRDPVLEAVLEVMRSE